MLWRKLLKRVVEYYSMKAEIMCWNHSQILVVSGLIFEFVSVAMTVKTVFWDIEEYIEKRILHKTIPKYRVTYEIKPRDGKIAFVFLIVGMVLQGVAVFV